MFKASQCRFWDLLENAWLCTTENNFYGNGTPKYHGEACSGLWSLSTNSRPVSKSRDHSRPIREQCSGLWFSGHLCVSLCTLLFVALIENRVIKGFSSQKKNWNELKLSDLESYSITKLFQWIRPSFHYIVSSDKCNNLYSVYIKATVLLLSGDILSFCLSRSLIYFFI